MTIQSYRQLSLGLSLAAHVAVGTVVVANVGTGPATQFTPPSSVLKVQLVKLDSSPGSTLAAAMPEAGEEMPSALPRTVATAAPELQNNEPAFLVPGQVEPHYFPTRELSLRPLVLKDIPPDIELVGVPAQTVILRLFINEEGDIDRVVTEQSFLPEEMARDLTDAFSKLKFHPGMRDGVPVKSQMKIEVKLEGGDTTQQ